MDVKILAESKYRGCRESEDRGGSPVDGRQHFSSLIYEISICECSAFSCCHGEESEPTISARESEVVLEHGQTGV